MKNKKTLISTLVLTIFFFCCAENKISHNSSTPLKINKSQQRQLDAILQSALDNEALYTILGDVKPISNVTSFSFPIANTDSLKRLDGDVLDLSSKQRYLYRIAEIQTLINTLNYPDLEFVLIPYQKAYNGKRKLQLSVIRVSLLDSLLQKEASFFGQFGLVPGSDPAVVISTIEGCGKYERLRAYGYLFGYPEYAIDFFVQAFPSENNSDKITEREFFRIPVYSGSYSNFVYAYPQNHTPDEIDSTIYFRAQNILYEYQKLRGKYLNQDNTLQSCKLLNELLYNEE